MLCRAYDDYIQYWSVWRLLLRGEDIYSAHAVLAAQQALSPSMQEPTMFWCPPWMLLLMAPVLRFDYCSSRWIWFAISVLCIVGAATLSWKALVPKDSPPLSFLLLATFFPPFFEAMRAGQINVLCVAIPALLAYALRCHSHALQGAAIALLAVKPHIFLLLGAALFIESIAKRDFRRWIWAGGFTALLIAAVELIAPGITLAWIGAILHPPLGVPSAAGWWGATMASVMRAALWHQYGQQTAMMAASLPLIAAALLILIRMRALSALKWEREELLKVYAPLLLLSYLLAPSGWFHDQGALAAGSALFIGALLLTPHSRVRAWWLMAYISLQAVTVLMQLGDSSQDQWFWYPLVLAALGAAAMPRLLPRVLASASKA